MKKLIVVALAFVFSTGVNAAGYMCRDYTDNVIDPMASGPSGGFKTDNPIKSMVTNIRTNPDGYTVSQNGLFKKTLKFTNPRFKLMDRYAEGPQGMIMKKLDAIGNPYFIVMTTSPTNNTKQAVTADITRMVTLAGCTER